VVEGARWGATAAGDRADPKRVGAVGGRPLLPYRIHKMSDIEDAVLSVQRRDPIDVSKALKDALKIRDEERLAKRLVSVAIDADSTSIVPLLHSVRRIKDENLRARTIFSVFSNLNSAVVGGFLRRGRTSSLPFY
jgi:hypothetical protein